MKGKNNGRDVMNMAKTDKPEPVQLFENLLWAHSPKHWILKSTYFQKKLFISMLIPTSEEQHQKIRRSFTLIEISQIRNIEGMAANCVDEMKNSNEKNNSI